MEVGGGERLVRVWGDPFSRDGAPVRVFLADAIGRNAAVSLCLTGVSGVAGAARSVLVSTAEGEVRIPTTVSEPELVADRKSVV